MLLDGPLYGKVHSFDNGSVWEMLKEDGTMVSPLHGRRSQHMAARLANGSMFQQSLNVGSAHGDLPTVNWPSRY